MKLKCSWHQKCCTAAISDFYSSLTPVPLFFTFFLWWWLYTCQTGSTKNFDIFF